MIEESVHEGGYCCCSCSSFAIGKGRFFLVLLVILVLLVCISSPCLLPMELPDCLGLIDNFAFIVLLWKIEPWNITGKLWVVFIFADFWLWLWLCFG